MKTIQVGNAPCSWGTLEFADIGGASLGYTKMLDELTASGYTGTELGDWGFMPTEPAELAQQLQMRQLTMTGAFVPVALRDQAAHAAGIDKAVEIAQLLAATADRLGSSSRPFLVLADENGTDPQRTTNAGRITTEIGLRPDQWQVFAEGANRVAAAVKQATGLRTVFHHHCAGFVETPDEIEQLLALTDPDLLGLVFDTGHYAFGAGSCAGIVAALDRWARRIWYVHFKDCSPTVMKEASNNGWDYFQAVAHGVFCELGQGCVTFPTVLQWLHAHQYQGFVTVEQDVLPGMGAPKESAQRNRDYLRLIGL